MCHFALTITLVWFWFSHNYFIDFTTVYNVDTFQSFVELFRGNNICHFIVGLSFPIGRYSDVNNTRIVLNHLFIWQLWFVFIPHRYAIFRLVTCRTKNVIQPDIDINCIFGWPFTKHANMNILNISTKIIEIKLLDSTV